MIDTDTIISLITPDNDGAIAVFRISGPHSISIIDKIFYPVQAGKKIINQTSHTIHLGNIFNQNGILDQVLISLFKMPNSYTGEDIIEISCHGSSYIRNQILQLCINNGARLARPGEFTLRSFLNGKIDLSQAEAVADLISSEAEIEHQIAIQQLRGGISSYIKILRKDLINFASLIELELDFSEEDITFIDRSKLYSFLYNLKENLELLINSFSLGNAIKNGISVSIIGEPNSGKSTLFNVLLNEERAITSKIPGTTRDTIEEEIILNGIRFRFIDTAGIRKTTNQIEKIGIQKTFEKIKESQVIFYLFDATIFNEKKILKNFIKIQSQYPKKIYFVISNKSDISLIKFHKNPPKNFFIISAKKLQGIDNLKNALVDLFNYKKLKEQSIVITTGRHYQALQKSLDIIFDVLQDLKNDKSSDLIAVNIRKILYYLGEITGEITTDDLLKNIFSQFCIGK